MNTDPTYRTWFVQGIKSVARLLLVLAMLLQLSGTALAHVWTDPVDYPPGSIVTIRGDNSDPDNEHNWLPMETVHVDVAGPNGYTAVCEGVADDLGAWTCDVTLWDGPQAIGTYTYTATGLASGNVEVELLRQTGAADMKFASASGDVIVRAPANLDADVEMSTASGSLKTDFPIQIEDRNSGSGRKAAGRLGGGSCRLKISTASGDVKLVR